MQCHSTVKTSVYKLVGQFLSIFNIKNTRLATFLQIFRCCFNVFKYYGEALTITPENIRKALVFRGHRKRCYRILVSIQANGNTGTKWVNVFVTEAYSKP